MVKAREGGVVAAARRCESRVVVVCMVTSGGCGLNLEAERETKRTEGAG